MRKRMMLSWAVALAAGVALTLSLGAGEGDNPWAGVDKAICVIQPTEGNTAKGTVTFTQWGDKVKIHADITGLNPNQKHAIHVHQYGDVNCMDGTCTGGHYNPTDKQHGLPPSEDRHAGDMGNLLADGDGHAVYDLTVDNLSVAGMKAPIIGRAIIVHAKPDDGGQPTGNAGGRIGYGVIGIAPSN